MALVPVEWVSDIYLMTYCFFVVGIFFVLPCIESYQKVDLRTITLGVPPQEVGHSLGLYPVPSIYYRMARQ